MREVQTIRSLVMVPLVHNAPTMVTIFAEVAIEDTFWIKAATAKTIPGIWLALVVTLVLLEQDGEEPSPGPAQVNIFRHTTATGTDTELDTDVGVTIVHGGGSTTAGGGGGSSDGSVDGPIGTKLKLFIGIAGVSKVIRLSRS